jgi:hypothetical protein
MIAGPIGVVGVVLNINEKLIRKILFADVDVMNVLIVLNQGRKTKAIKIRTDHLKRREKKQHF